MGRTVTTRCLVTRSKATRSRRRRGSATLDYVLLMGIVLPMATFVLWVAPRIMQLVYEVLCLFMTAPWM